MRAGRLSTVLTLAAALTAGVAAAAEPPRPDLLLREAMEAAGGTPALVDLGYLKLSVTEEETTRGGETKTTRFEALLRTRGLDPVRLEFPGDVVLVAAGPNAWATVRGTLDRRPQTPLMVRRTQRMKLFPLLVPYTLKLDGVRVTGVKRVEFEGRPMWRLSVEVPEAFFAHPVMNTTWYVYLDPETGLVELAEYRPRPAMRVVMPENARYRYLRRTRIGGVLLPTRVVLEGFDDSNRATGHVRVTKISYERVEAPDPTLFASPDTLERLDQGEPMGGG